MSILYQFLFAIISTIIIEIAVFRVFKIYSLEFFKLQILLNSVTNLGLNLVLTIINTYLPNGYIPAMIIGECIVLITEVTINYLFYKKNLTMVISTCIANVMTLSFGLVISLFVAF